MARNKAGRPGGPPRSPSGSEPPPDRSCNGRGKQDGGDSRRGWRRGRGSAAGGARGSRRAAPRCARFRAPCRSFVGRRSGRRQLAATRTAADWRISARRGRSTRERGRSRIPGRDTQSRTTGCASGAEDVAQLARRARGRHRRRRRRGACAQLLGALSGQRAAGQLARPGSRCGADAGRRRGAKRRRRATDLAAGRAGARLGRGGRREDQGTGRGAQGRRCRPAEAPGRIRAGYRPGRRCRIWQPGSISWRLRLQMPAARQGRARR